MFREIHCTTLDDLIGNKGSDHDPIRCCCLSGNTLYLGISQFGMVTCQVSRDGNLQLLSSLSLPDIEGMYDLGVGMLLLDTRTKIFIWNGRKKRCQLLLKKKDEKGYRMTTFLRRIFVSNERGVQIYSNTGRLVASFESRGISGRIFVNSQHIFVGERVYSNDGYFSLIKTLEGSAEKLDEQYLYCSSLESISLVSITSLEMVSYGDFEQFEPYDYFMLVGVVRLEPNKVLVKDEYSLSLFEIQTQNNNDKEMQLVWDSDVYRNEGWFISDSLLVLDTDGLAPYLCLDVRLRKVTTIQICD